VSAKIRASAPGKLVLSGEYAVLEGASAVSMAVGVRAEATVARTEAADSQLNIRNINRTFDFRFDGQGLVEWLGSEPGPFGTALSAALPAAAAADGIGSQESLLIELDTAGFYTDVAGETLKMGMGSSAAVMVALCGALKTQFTGLTELADQRFTDMCLKAHHDFQGKTGSGVDIVTSVHGGVQLFVPGSGNSSCTVPAGLHLLPVWTGIAAETPVYLKKVQGFRDQFPDRYADLMSSLCSSAEQTALAWQQEDADVICGQTEAYALALEKFDDTVSAGIFSPAHQALKKIGLAHSCVYKPSGAGGGDFGVYFAKDQRAIEAVRATCTEEGFSMPVFKFPTVGVVIEEY
jgi:phosphomevalonate kinase